MEFRDYYQMLEVERAASQEEIKRAYRKLARKYHPDVSKEANAEDRFKEINEAYEVLKDPEKRKAYDQVGADWQPGQEFTPPPNWETGFDFSGGGYTQANAAEFSDFFESLFGRARDFDGARSRGHSFNLRGEDTHARIMIRLADAYTGATRSIRLNHTEYDANGRARSVQRSFNVGIPKGIAQGQNIRLAGQGGAGHNAPAGDLYLSVHFLPDEFFKAEGKDVFLELPITPWEAALGATVILPTPLGKRLELKIPANTEDGRKMRLKGKGIPAKEPGDLYVELRVKLPKVRTEQEIEAYKALAATFAFNPRESLDKMTPIVD